MLAASIVFAALFAVSAFAQAAQPAGTGRVALINTYAFGEDKAGAGITRYKNAVKALNDEFAPVNNELRADATKLQTLATEIQNLQKSAAPVDPKTIQAKVDQAQTLETSIKRKQEDAKARYERRQAEVVGPVYSDIIKALNDFARQKGYAVILDGAKLEEAQILLGFDDKYDVTKEFITFYNARPAGTASTATTPK
jgi:Skp family chaperone for outer membrane proteins